MADSQARRSARAGKSDEVLRGNIRNEQGSAYKKPSNIAAREKIVFRSSFLHRKVHADSEDNGEIDPDDHEIDGCERSVGNRDRRCEQHPCLLGAEVVEPDPAYCLKRTSAFFANWLFLPQRNCSISPASALKKAP